MKWVLPVIAMLMLPACMGGGGTSVSATPPPLPPTQPVSAGFGTILNQARSDHGAGALTQDPRLMLAAQNHSNDQYMMGKMTHEGSDGSKLRDRLGRVNYPFTLAAENVARGQQSEQQVFDDWMDSTGHRRNNLNPLFEDYGIAKAGSGSNRYWTLVFGRTSPVPPGTF
ncbi:CAP domain-containing protein [Yoonia sp.]|uniref:CAP domain-containing protein n=1 Tax=Yoonia sp. TaxID=2212373 RepID=UPI002FD99AF5